mgnify:CR=1 FL=1
MGIQFRGDEWLGNVLRHGAQPLQRGPQRHFKRVSVAQLAELQPCAYQFRTFKLAFPNGITIPTNMDKAVALGLDIQWGAKAIGIPLPTPW